MLSTVRCEYAAACITSPGCTAAYACRTIQCLETWSSPNTNTTNYVYGQEQNNDWSQYTAACLIVGALRAAVSTQPLPANCASGCVPRNSTRKPDRLPHNFGRSQTCAWALASGRTHPSALTLTPCLSRCGCPTPPCNQHHTHTRCTRHLTQSPSTRPPTAFTVVPCPTRGTHICKPWPALPPTSTQVLLTRPAPLPASTTSLANLLACAVDTLTHSWPAPDQAPPVDAHTPT